MVEYYEGGDLAVVDGLRFRRDKKTGYFLSSKKIVGKRKRLHIYMWEREHGKVPRGCQIHHIDFDKNNNEPSNLVALSTTDHQQLHGITMSEERKEASRKNLMENAIPKAIWWHKSAEGRAWHSFHGKVAAENRQLVELVCDYCGERFESKQPKVTMKNRFCSNNCKSAYRRRSGVDDVEKECSICGSIFLTNKYASAKRCTSCRHKRNCV